MNLIWIVVIVTSIWVLVDAKTIGVKRGQVKGLGDMGPWGWFFVCLLIWVIGFPFYLAKRSQFKAANGGSATALIPCKSCSQPISRQAETCPNCGLKTPKRGAAVGTLMQTVIIIVVVAGLAVIYANMPDNSQTAANAGAFSHPHQSAPAPVVIDVPIRKLLHDYQANEVAADNSYKGKLVQVRGVVTGIKKDITDSLYVTLGSDGEFEIPELQAFFSDSQNSTLAKLHQGQMLTVVCKIDGLMLNVIGRHCIPQANK